MLRNPKALAGLAAGVALVVVALVAWLVGGASPAPTGPAPAVAAVPTTEASTSAAPTTTAAPSSAATTGSAPSAARPAVKVPKAAPDAPAQLRIPAIGVDSPVVSVGVDGRGEMEVPQDVRTIGWYRFGPSPGDRAGSAVLSGHVDDRVQGRGAFFDLRELEAGDRVEVVRGDGAVRAYRVRTVERISKGVLPVDRIFARTGAPHLTLVTCGGDFDRATRNYVDNIVVTADPA